MTFRCDKLYAWRALSLAALLVLAVDRITKSFMAVHFSQGQSIKILPDVFHITLIFNSGAAFGLFKEGTPFFISLSLIAVTAIILYIRRRQAIGAILAVSLGLILGGAIGNLIDRIRFGHVIDFLDFRIWPVFNIADSAITIGTAMLVLNLVFSKSKASP